MEQYYSISQVAKLLNLTPQTLRFYEQEGLIHPQKSANGYRRYTMENIREIQDIVYYRNIDMSLEEIRNIFYHTDFSAWEKILNEKIREEQEKIMRHRSYLNRLELFSRSIAQSIQPKIPIIRRMPTSYILYHSAWPLPIDKMESYLADYIGLVWTYEVFKIERDFHGCLPEPNWILRIIEADTLENLSFDKNFERHLEKEHPLPTLELPECVNLLLPSPIRSASGLNLSSLFDWCGQNHIRLETTVFSRYVFNATENGQSSYYMELFCPIAEKVGG